MGNETTLPETCLSSIFQRVRHQNAKKKKKKHGSHSVCEYKTTLRKTYLLRVLELLTYQNDKTHGKHTLLRNITLPKTLPKTRI